MRSSVYINGHVPTNKNAKASGSLHKILALLTPAEKRRGLLVLLLVIVMALLETVGVASILPFLAVLGDPDMVHQNEYLALAYSLGGFTSTQDFLFALGIVAFALVVGSTLLRALTHYVMIRFTTMRIHSLSSRLLHGYLRRPYNFFLTRNSADLGKTMLSETQELITNTLQPAIQIVAYSLVALALIILLVVVDPLVACIVAAVIGFAYFGIFWGVRAVLSRIGLERREANRARFTLASEVTGGIKELKVLGRERLYVNRFDRASARYARHNATNRALGLLPKFLIEALGFGGILGLCLALMATRQNLGEVLPILGLYAFAAYRLLPAVQIIYNGFTSLRFGMPALDAIYADLQESDQIVEPVEVDPPTLSLSRSIRFESVRFTYHPALPPVLHDLNLEIRANTSVGFVGSTGSGKTTAADLLLGLLEPSAGRILIDDMPLTPENVRAWQRQIGYVPQFIYLADASITENIAFGVPPAEIDQAAVERTARMASIHRFVMEELPEGYATIVGERGVRLSGGQRQRIGIARALYHDPAVLVFDEATSSLDNATEAIITEAIQELHQQKTIIMIAHRLSTIEKANTIVVFENGRIAAQGDCVTLAEISHSFRALAQGSSSYVHEREDKINASLLETERPTSNSA